MKVLHVCFSNYRGGAAKAAYRLHRAMLLEGIDSQFLVAQKQGDDPTVIAPRSKFRRLFFLLIGTVSRLLVRLQKSTNPIYHSVNLSPTLLYREINRSNADVVNLHWINDEMISIAEIGKITKPIFWTLHDSWPFCGAEHHAAEDDLRYQKGYSSRNRPKDYKGLDIDRWTWKRKLIHWKELQITAVAPSRWLAEIASSSQVFKHRSVTNIPNGIDLSVFFPFPQNIARERFGIAQDKKIILVGAMGAMSDPNKGYDLVQQAFERLASTHGDEFEVVVFGALKQTDTVDEYFKTHYIGILGDEVSLAIVYSLADVYVVPSRKENLPNTIVEAFACGCPVAAFDTGGIPDIIDHQQNGYLAEAYKTDDLACGIEWILNDDHLARLKVDAQRKAKHCFDIKNVARQYLRLYQHTLHDTNE